MPWWRNRYTRWSQKPVRKVVGSSPTQGTAKINMFKVGDFIKSKQSNPHRLFKGKVIKIEGWGLSSKEDNIVYIELTTGGQYCDYVYTFELDIEKIRNEKIENLLNADIV